MNEHEVFPADSRKGWVPAFLREIEELGENLGLIEAIHQTLEKDGISVEVEGGFDQLKAHEEGILFVGDHKYQLEFIALIDMLSQMGRNDLINIAKFYVQRNVYRSLGQAASQLTLPVYPRILARDRDNFLNYEIINRIKYRRHLLTMAESEEENTRSLLAASEHLSHGGITNIYPTGRVVDAALHPWRAGVGKIIQHITDEAKHDVLIAPYGMKDFKRARCIGALAFRGKGWFGRPQTMNVELGPLQTVAELLDSLSSSDREDPVAITAQLQQQFIEHFT